MNIDRIVNKIVYGIINENDNMNSFSNFKNIIESELLKVNEFLSPYSLKCVFNYKYDFSSPHYRDFLAIYQRLSANRGTIRIGINLPKLNESMEEYGLTDINLQIRISIWHEVGHGIMDYIRFLRRRDTQGKYGVFSKKMKNDFSGIENGEEFFVEKFGAYKCDEEYFSDLQEFLDEYDDEIKKLVSLPPTHNQQGRYATNESMKKRKTISESQIAGLVNEVILRIIGNDMEKDTENDAQIRYNPGGFIPGEVKNKALKRALIANGLDDIHLIKGDGYFYLEGVTSDGIDDFFDGEIYMNSFNQQSVQDWINDIIDVIERERQRRNCGKH